MPSEQIQWFPGHMAKTRRMISENLKNVDVVIELLDARIPKSSRNPEIARLTAGKPHIILLNKTSLADPEMTSLWCKHYSSEDTYCIPTDCVSGTGIPRIKETVDTLLAEKIARYDSKGMSGRRLKAMIVGIPNVGKSSLINKICGGKKAKVENRPGVTLDKQWVSTSIGLDLMDMPGVLWPKFDDRTTGENLALTGAIKDKILDTETLGLVLCRRLRALYPELLIARYKLGDIDITDMTDLEIFDEIGRRRGFMMRGGEIDYERTANMLLDELRSGRIGRITLDRI